MERFETFGCDLQEEQRFKTFAPIVSQVNENKKNGKNQKMNAFFLNKIKNVRAYGPGLRKHRGVIEKNIYFVKFCVTSRYFAKISRYVAKHILLFRENVSRYFAKITILLLLFCQSCYFAKISRYFAKKYLVILRKYFPQ